MKFHKRMLLQLIFILAVTVVLVILLALEYTPFPSHSGSVLLTQGWQYHWENPNKKYSLSAIPTTDTTLWTHLTLPTSLKPPSKTKILWLSLPLPPGNWQSPSLYFQGIPHLLNAYLQNQLIYTFDELDSTGNLKHKEGKFPIISLPVDYAEKTLYLQVYVGEKNTVPLAYHGMIKIGSLPLLVKELILRDIVKVTLGSLFITFGTFPLILSIFKNTNKSYISFGWFLLLLGIHTITPTQIIRLIFNYSLTWTYIHHTAFHLIPVSLYIFFEHIFCSSKHKIIGRLWQIQLGYFPIALILGTFGYWKIATHPTQFLAVTGAIIMLLITLKTAFKGNQEAKIFALGFTIFLVCSIYDIIVYVFLVDFGNNVQLYYWGMLIFVVAIAYILERRFIEASQQLKTYNLAMARFVPHEFLRFLGKESIVDINLGDEVQKNMTILFADIRSFTTISENMSPKKNIDFLNAYLSYVSPVIRDNQGFIDKYIGDAVMALFPGDTEDAVQAAIEMQIKVREFNQVSQDYGYPTINIGVGLHRGNLMLGTIGENQRLETTVISDAVNLASRLEDSTKKFGASVIISDDTLLSLRDQDRYLTRYLGRITVKGKKQGVRIYELYDYDPDNLKIIKTSTKIEFEKAIALYDLERYTEAQSIFLNLWQQFPEDIVISFCLKNCSEALEHHH